jgi:RNA polymerase sigma-70 factor (ECF subfamily)
MLLHDSRRAARVTDRGDLILLEDQDRSRWNRAQIEEGVRLVEEALLMRRPGSYQVQAAIAAVHAEATTAEETDWPQIAVLYEQLLRYERSPVIELNRAVAISFASGPLEGLGQLDAIPLTDVLEQYAPFHLARADMYRRLGRASAAQESYRRALALARNEQVRRFIQQRLETS